MDISQFERATLDCLAKTDANYADAKIIKSTPLTGGYSRQTYKFELSTSGGTKDVILQYLPKGATGLVRVDRGVERDLLTYLSGQTDIPCSKLITSDMDAEFFDSTAHIFEAETGTPFAQICRDADEKDYGALNRVVARTGALVHRSDISKLPNSMSRPTSWSDYLDEQIESFKKTEADSKTSRPFLRYMAKWLDENRPDEIPLSLVHGDFQVSNMLKSDRETGALLVDWELAHIGDPREDLGWFTMVCGAIPPNILEADVEGFYDSYREATGWGKDVINLASSAYFMIISSIRTHMGMMKSSDALSENPAQAQSVLAAYYLNITTYQHMNWVNAVNFIESQK